MLLVKSFFILKFFLQLNFYFLFFSLLLCSIIFYLSKSQSIQSFIKNSSSFNFLKICLSTSLLVSFFIHCLAFWIYIYTTYNFFNVSISNNFLFLPNLKYFLSFKIFNVFTFNIINIFFSIDFFGFVLLFLAYIVGFISLLTLDTRLFWKNIKYLFTFNIFAIIVYIYVSVSNLIIFFLMYEFLLIPSFFFVYFVSPSRRAIQASIYFVIWTQIGSFLVLCAISYILGISSCFDFYTLKSFKFTNDEVWYLYFVFFLGFGFKVPIWPFHYWLTKTHVEAASGFSIYLSGFLVKSALYGFYKLSNCLSCEFDSTVFIIISIMGVIDASLKMWGQTDLKKLVAYGTIQEMNLIYLVFCWGDTNSIVAGILFSATHAFLSALMFFLVDCIYRRFHTRSLVEINGILHLSPNLGVAILVMTVFFSGLPGTIKFISEFYIFNGFMEISPVICFILMFTANVFGLIGFSKCWFNAVFGMFKKNLKYVPFDLTYKELIIITFCFAFLLFFSFIANFLI